PAEDGGRVGLRILALALALATPVSFVQSRQQPGGGFAEPGSAPTPGLTAWAVLGLRTAGVDTGDAHAYLVAHESELASATDLDLAAIAEELTGGATPALAARVRKVVAAPPTLNAAMWGILALRQLGEPAPPAAVKLLLANQRPSGGWSWNVG